MRRRWLTKALLGTPALAGLLALAMASPAPRARPLDPVGIQRLEAESGGTAEVSLDRATGAVRFLRVPAGGISLAGATPRERAAEFLERHGRIFGVADRAGELAEDRTWTDRGGSVHHTYQQRYNGVPVFAGEIRLHFDAQGRMTAANGSFLPGIEIDPVPKKTGAQAAVLAVAHVENQKDVGSLVARDASLMVFRAGLAKGVPGADHLAFEVEVGNGQDVREFVYIDAHSGKVVDQITGIYDALSRRVHEFNFDNLIWSEGEALPGDPEIDGVIHFAEDVYDLFANISGGTYLSWDGSDAVMHSVWDPSFLGCPNASWNGQSANYCPGVAADDTVGHEWGHAYTERTHNLVYQWQSGALNESYSDIFGEIVDFINGAGTDSPIPVRTVDVCAAVDSYRWLAGEDDPAFGGAIRDMWHPPCFGDPGKVSDAAQYWCSTADSGGVHTNSGVPNHAFALLVDGGTYNGHAVASIGLTKATHVYWRAMEVYQIRNTDFAGHADALEQSCADLTGVDVLDLTTGVPSGEVITSTDCQQVANAMLAVEMRAEPTSCNFTSLLDPDPPAVSCEVETFFDDFETDPTAAWGRSNQGPAPEYTPRDWEWTADLPSGVLGSGFFATDGQFPCGPEDQSGTMSLVSPAIALGPTSNPALNFDHWVATETGYDGGNVKISVNGGSFTVIPDVDFSFNPYTETLLGTNPLAGEPGFSGTDGGTAHGSWGQSQVDLSAHAGQGDTIRLRFDFGVDYCNGFEGWYLDNVQLCTQTAANAAPQLNDLIDVFLFAGDALDVLIFASDLEGHNIALSGAGLPSWATVLDLGGGIGRLQLRPTPIDGGIHPMTVMALDDGAPPESDLSSAEAYVLACSAPAPTVVPSIDLADGFAAWSVIDATTHRVVRGDIASLRSSGGDYSSAAVTCAVDYMDTPLFALFESPSPGEVIWYLVQGISCGGRGTFDSAGGGQIGSRDAGIDASVVGCDLIGCGNGYRDLTEACDGLDFTFDTCESLGFNGGALGCNVTCDLVDTSGCF